MFGVVRDGPDSVETCWKGFFFSFHKFLITIHYYTPNATLFYPTFPKEIQLLTIEWLLKFCFDNASLNVTRCLGPWTRTKGMTNSKSCISFGDESTCIMTNGPLFTYSIGDMNSFVCLKMPLFMVVKLSIEK